VKSAFFAGSNGVSGNGEMCQCTFPRHPGRVEVMVMVPGFMEILMGISWGYWDFFRDSWDNNPEYLWD